mmetsp:Transcript_34221/g.74820  ORF Transcript_34221/g.74820 Transcript_34221/m.74820 type:complete len:820 (-) Transcript_34221:121-2580(-)
MAKRIGSRDPLDQAGLLVDADSVEHHGDSKPFLSEPGNGGFTTNVQPRNFLDKLGTMLTTPTNVRLGCIGFCVVSVLQILTMYGSEGEPEKADISSGTAAGISVVCGGIALLYALHLTKLVLSCPVGNAKMQEIAAAIQEGSRAFLIREYTWLSVFVGCVAVVMAMAVSPLTGLSFVLGAAISGGSGYLGMSIAVRGNVRTCAAAVNGLDPALRVAFNTGSVMGMLVVGTGLMGLSLLFLLLQSLEAGDSDKLEEAALRDLAGFGFGASSIALFARVGGGIYTKAADVGADLVGKVEAGIPEDDPRNPATIADNVGDNVGDVAGMGADLFGSFGEATCAALVIAAQSKDLVDAGWDSLMFPMYISGAGIIVCMATSFVATDLQPVTCEADVERVLKVQLGLSTALMTIAVYPLTFYLPSQVYFGEGSFAEHCPALANDSQCISNAPFAAFCCIAAGLWGGCIIGFVTEYFTSHSYQPVREVARSTETGAATNIIYGLALGYKSTIVPVGVLSFIVYVSFSYMDMYGVALAALGMLGTLATCLSIDVYGPVCDNAGGIAEMAELPEEVREKTDALDAAGNTTAAIGKGFAIGSAALVSLALSSAFVKRTKVLTDGVNMLDPVTFAFLLIGSMLPYWFSALTMKSVGTAALAMVEEVRRQFRENAGILEGTVKPDYKRCVQISTSASLNEMIAPGALVLLAPVITGTLFGTKTLAGLLAGSLVSGVQIAISASNTGGAWDNAKKYIEAGRTTEAQALGGKGSDAHTAAVIGDTVGDPLKDTSGPSLNILIKLMAVESLVFASFFKEKTPDGLLFKMFSDEN